MPATHHIDSDAQLIITTWEGEARDVEFIDAIKNYQQNIQNKPTCNGFNEVLDLSKLTQVKLTTGGIINLGRIAANTDKGDIKTKLAIIVSSRLVFGFARMYVSYRSFSSQANKEIRVFNNKQTAFAWVQVESLVDHIS